MMPITKKLIKFNFSSGNDIKYIVVHDTANTDRGADAEAHYRYFNGGDRQSSAHYFVDDKEIVQLVQDYNASWHCGDGGGRYGITNHNSIGVEICVNSDCNYEKAVSNAVDLVKFLMQKYSISIDRVVRHYDASRKICPESMRHNNWERWWNFKSRLSSSASSQVKNNNQTQSDNKAVNDSSPTAFYFEDIRIFSTYRTYRRKLQRIDNTYICGTYCFWNF